MNKPKVNHENIPIIPDPWEGNGLNSQEMASQVSRVADESSSLINLEAASAILPGVSPQLLSIQLLLEDWIKLGRERAGQLNADITAAIGLLSLQPPVMTSS